MKVLIFSFYFSPDLCAGSFRCQGLVDALQEQLPANSEIEIVTTLPNRYASYSVSAPEYEEQDNLKIHRIKLPSHSSGMVDQAMAFKSYYFKALSITKNKDYDVVVATSSRLFTAFLGARFAGKKVPLYLDIRDIFTDTLEDVLAKPMALSVLPVIRMVEAYTLKKATQVNLVSPGFNPYFEAKYPGTKYENYTNGIDEVFFKDPVSPETKNDDEPKVILYAGNIGESQGLHNVLPDLAKLLENDNVIIKVIGDGGRKNQLVEKIAQQNVSNIQLLDPVDRNTLIEHYKKADILFCHLNDMKAFLKVLPSKIFEYAIFNKPILAGVSGYAVKFFRENLDAVQLFSPCNAKEAYDAFQRIDFQPLDNAEFTERFRRKNVMREMAKSIINLAQSK